MQLVSIEAPFRIPTKQEIAAARKLAKECGVRKLLSIGTDPKTEKSNNSGLADSAGRPYYTAIQYLAPARQSGYETCASRSAGCTAACLYTAGNPIYLEAKKKARIARTKFYFEHRREYFVLLYAEIAHFARKCESLGYAPAIRLNGTSDIVWEKVAGWIFETFPDVKFYDYTKHVKRMQSGWTLPSNLDLTFSRSETNETDCLQILRDNPTARVAVVFGVKRLKPLPAKWHRFNVCNADLHDLRFLDSSRVSGLRAKGEAKKDSSGFVAQCGGV